MKRGDIIYVKIFNLLIFVSIIKPHRAKFTAAMTASRKIYDAANSKAKVVEIIGGNVAKNIMAAKGREWDNTCAIRMSYILNFSGMPIPHFPKNTLSGADKRWYFFRVSDVIAFLTQQWGKPDLIVPWPTSEGDQLAGKKGIVLFEVTGWDNASGHATLWDGKHCYDHCYFNERGANYKTSRALFWSLP